MNRCNFAFVRSMKILPVLLLACACSSDDDNPGNGSGTGGSGGAVNTGGTSSTGGTTNATGGGGGQPATGGTGGQPGTGGVVGTGGTGGTPPGDGGGATGGTAGSGAGGGTGGTPPGDASTITYKDICSCTFATAEDHTGQAAVTVNFGGITLGNTYSPKCIIVDPGTDVTFAGSFATHPLRAYTDAAHTDPNNPIQSTSAGTTATFSFTTAGSYGYYCSAHVGLGMCGAVYVAQ